MRSLRRLTSAGSRLRTATNRPMAATVPAHAPIRPPRNRNSATPTGAATAIPRRAALSLIDPGPGDPLTGVSDAAVETMEFSRAAA